MKTKIYKCQQLRIISQSLEIDCMSIWEVQYWLQISKMQFNRSKEVLAKSLLILLIDQFQKLSHRLQIDRYTFISNHRKELSKKYLLQLHQKAMKQKQLSLKTNLISIKQHRSQSQKADNRQDKLKKRHWKGLIQEESIRTNYSVKYASRIEYFQGCQLIIGQLNARIASLAISRGDNKLHLNRNLIYSGQVINNIIFGH